MCFGPSQIVAVKSSRKCSNALCTSCHVGENAKKCHSSYAVTLYSSFCMCTESPIQILAFCIYDYIDH